MCVPPGGPPEGILDIAEYIVCRVFLFSLFLYFVPAPFFFGEGVNFSAKRPLSQKKRSDFPNIKNCAAGLSLPSLLPRALRFARVKKKSAEIKKSDVRIFIVASRA